MDNSAMVTFTSTMIIFIAAKQNIFDTELYQKSGQATDWIHYIDEKAKSLLTVNDYTALMKHIKDVSFSGSGTILFYLYLSCF